MPKLKGGDLKVPPFLSDLYFDLRDRRLLPIIALILVAIVAAPFLLGGGSKEVETPRVRGPLGAAGAAPSSNLTVVQAEPGLRNYRKRLARRKPTDPFKQRFTGPVLAGAELQSESSTTTTTTTGESGGSPETGSSTPLPSESGSSPPTAPSPPAKGGGGSGSLPSNGAFFAFAVNVQITRIETKPDGKQEKTGPVVHKEVLPPTSLPGEKAPVVTYIGIGPKTHKPLFVVSSEVTSTFGEAKCLAGTGTCQVIEVEPGFPETFVYGAAGVRYKINVLKVEPVVTGHS